MAVTGVNDYTSTYAATNSGSTRGSSGLSEAGQNYLNELKQKYSDVSITVADFSNDRQYKSYMLGCNGYNNIAISSSVIEKMASDPVTAAKYEKIIADVPNSAEEVKKGCEAQGTELIAFSVIVDKNGKVGYCGVGKGMSGENPGTAYKETIQKQLEEKRAKKKEEEKFKEKRIEQAETIEKLLEKIKANAQDETVDGALMKISEKGKGTQLDLSV